MSLFDKIKNIIKKEHHHDHDKDTAKILPDEKTVSDFIDTVINLEKNDDSSSCSGKIIIYDDSPTFCSVLTKELSSFDFKVKSYDNPIYCMEQIAEFKPNLIVMDINMPQMSGMEAVRRIRKNPEFSAIKIIVLSSINVQQAQANAIKAGADLYITKETPIENVIKMIKDYMPINEKNKNQ